MKPKQERRRVGEVPPRRAPVKLPPRRSMGQVPGGRPKGHAPTAHVAPAPKARPAAKPPNPRKPLHVRDTDGGVLGDLFAVFPDLPWPRPRRPRPISVRPRRRSR